MPYTPLPLAALPVTPVPVSGTAAPSTAGLPSNTPGAAAAGEAWPTARAAPPTTAPAAAVAARDSRCRRSVSPPGSATASPSRSSHRPSPPRSQRASGAASCSGPPAPASRAPMRSSSRAMSSCWARTCACSSTTSSAMAPTSGPAPARGVHLSVRLAGRSRQGPRSQRPPPRRAVARPRRAPGPDGLEAPRPAPTRYR